MNKHIAIIGYGVVGKGMEKIFPDAYIYDHKYIYSPEEQTNISGIVPSYKSTAPDNARTLEIINRECGLAIICLPTPPHGMKEQRVDEDENKWREVDLSVIESVLVKLRVPNVLIKSAVPPGTTDMLSTKYGWLEDGVMPVNICVSPEYLGESTYYVPPQYPDPRDARQHSFMVIGGSSEGCDKILSYFVERLGPSKFYYKCTAVEAELIKYMENTWGAMKVTFANEWFEICKAFGASYYSVRQGWALDPRVEPMHTMVFERKRGFGGKCFPKDLLGIIASSEKRGYDARLLKQVWITNKEMLKKNEHRTERKK